MNHRERALFLELLEALNAVLEGTPSPDSGALYSKAQAYLAAHPGKSRRARRDTRADRPDIQFHERSNP